MKKRFFILILFVYSISYSQVQQEWVQRFNGQGNANDYAKSIALDLQGNIIVTGYFSDTNIYTHYATIKYNNIGVQQWVQIYRGPVNEWDEALSVAVDDSGNIYVTGDSRGQGTNLDFATIKYNSSGVQQWVQRYNGPGNSYDQFPKLIVDHSSNVYVIGSSVGIEMNHDIATIKYNSSGVQQWVARYNGPANSEDAASSVAVDNFGNVYVTGGSLASYDCVTIKYNSSGVQQWVQSYTGQPNSHSSGGSILLDGFGNLYVAGGISQSSGGNDFLLIKYSLSGAQQWVQRYNGPGNSDDDLYSMALDISGNIYLTGNSIGIDTYKDYATIKYNSSGVQQWVQRYNGPGNNDDYATSLVIDSFNNIYVTGYSQGSGTGYDYATIRYDSSGTQKWVIRYNGPVNSNDFACSIILDASKNVYVTGGSTGNNSNLDYTTIKYSQTIGIKTISSDNPETFSLSQNYPNPFNPNTRIKFDVGHPLTPLLSKEGTGVVLNIYDILGREVSTLVNEKLQPGTYEVEFDGSNYPSGVYFYKLSATGGTESFTQTKRMVLIK